MLQTLSVWFSACLVPTDGKTRWEKKRVEKPPLEDLDRQSRPGRATKLGVFINATAWHCTFGCITSVSHFVYHIVSQWHLMNYHWHSLTYLTFIDSSSPFLHRGRYQTCSGMGGTVEIVVVVSHGSHFSSTAWRKVLAWEIILWIPGHDFIISSFHHSITSSAAQGGGGSFRIGNL